MKPINGYPMESKRIMKNGFPYLVNLSLYRETLSRDSLKRDSRFRTKPLPIQVINLSLYRETQKKERKLQKKPTPLTRLSMRCGTAIPNAPEPIPKRVRKRRGGPAFAPAWNPTRWWPGLNATSNIFEPRATKEPSTCSRRRHS